MTHYAANYAVKQRAPDFTQEVFTQYFTQRKGSFLLRTNLVRTQLRSEIRGVGVRKEVVRSLVRTEKSVFSLCADIC